MLEGIVRDSIGKRSTKDLRQQGYLIANIYGKNVENIHCAFKRNEFMKYVRNKPSLRFDVKLGDKTYKVVIKEYQKDPILSELLHVDLMIADDGVVANFIVPVKTAGTPIGLKNKGVLIYSKRLINVKCDAKNLPDTFTLNVDKLDVGTSILIRDIEVPEGVEITMDGRIPVVGMIKAK
jgi:large subunit ribosomal protein L25